MPWILLKGNPNGTTNVPENRYIVVPYSAGWPNVRKLSETPPLRISRDLMNRSVRRDRAITNREHVRTANPGGSLETLGKRMRTRAGEERQISKS